MLCEKCFPMFQGQEWGQHHADLTSFTHAAESGCYICKPLLQYALRESRALENCMVEPYEYRIYGSHIIIDLIMLTDGKETPHCRSFETIPSSELTADFSIRNRTLNVPLLNATQTAQRWMSECLNRHEKCQKNTQPRSYPRRLLDLNGSILRLILPAEEKVSGPYAALSYCWGPNPTSLCLTVSNLERFQACIFYSELPIAFREAIDFIKSLSIRYLWVDRLCIIQSGPGSAEEWQSECSKMQDVYSNCILNLSLSRAAHPNESCLGGWSPDSTPPFEVESTAIAGSGQSIKHTVVSFDYHDEALYSQPLSFRAWALQERVLAPRVLSFGLGELFWDCVQVPNASESLPNGPGSLLSTYDVLTEKGIPMTSDKPTLVKAWFKILEEYTGRELTYPEKDKLAAVFGVATQMGTAMDDVYIAGHFWETLPRSLNWQVQLPMEDKRRKRIPRRIIEQVAAGNGERYNKTPSWSWASMDGPLFLYNNRDECVANVEAHTMISMKDALKIKTFCAEIDWVQEVPIIRSDSWTRDDEVYFLDIDFDDPIDKPIDGTRSWLALLVEDSWLRTWAGLVLQQEEIEGDMLYRRIGHFCLGNTQKSPKRLMWRDDFKMGFGQEKRVITLI